MFVLLAQGLVFLLEHNVNEFGTDLTFSLEVQEFGVTKVIDLKPNGRNIVVTEENKQEYVRLVCQELNLREKIDKEKQKLKKESADGKLDEKPLVVERDGAIVVTNMDVDLVCILVQSFWVFDVFKFESFFTEFLCFFKGHSDHP